MALWIILGVIVIIALYVIGVYNSLISMRNKVKNSWAQIDVQLKRRFDLIPNIVNTVKGYAEHEKETLERVVEARNKFTSASTPEDRMEANNELTRTLDRLMVVVERYPDLKANQGFIQLQGELSATEDKISFSRQFYNDIVMGYNTSIQRFPRNIVAGMFNFKEETFFEIDEASRQAPTVSF
ncbi:MAG: LemA family protein [Clostridiales bacterium]|nr:LemA family protein [Clostridiales bacterium]